MISAAFSNRGSDTAVSDALTDLGLDLRSSFNHAADERFSDISWSLRSRLVL